MKKNSFEKLIARDERAAKKLVKTEVLKTRHKLAAVLSSLLVAAQLFAGGLIADPNSSIVPKLPDSSEIIKITNEDRVDQKLAALTESTELDNAAARKLEDMDKYNYWDHVSPSGVEPWSFITAAGYKYSYAGENLGKGFMSADTLVTAWMNSEKHRANILNSHFTNIGLASGVITLNSKKATVTVEMFGNPKTEVAGASLFTPVALAAQDQPNVSITTPVSDNNLLFFMLWAILFGIIVFDGYQLRKYGLHKSRKHMFQFRTALLINCLAFLLLFINIAAIS